MTAIFSHLRGMLRHEPLWDEFWSGVGIVMWSKLLLWGTIDLDQQDNYRFISSLMSDTGFELIGFCVGAGQLAAVCTNHRWGRTIMASLAALFWLTLAHALWLGNSSAPGVAAHLALGLSNLGSVALIRLRPTPHG